MDIAEDKRRLRAAAKATRAAAQAADPMAPTRLAERFLASVPVAVHDVVAGYWPIGEEMDVRPLLRALDARGVALCLPAVSGAGLPLVFRRWRPGDDLVAGTYGIPAPDASAEQMTPSILLVPLLAFDDEGWRLGYGAGYYDRTLAQLRAPATDRAAADAQPVMAVGVAYAAQRLAAVPRYATDERLDAVVTEAAVRRFAP